MDRDSDRDSGRDLRSAEPTRRVGELAAAAPGPPQYTGRVLRRAAVRTRIETRIKAWAAAAREVSGPD